MRRRSPILKLCALICTAVFVLVSLKGCVVSRKEIYDIKKKTSRIGQDLYRLQNEVDQRLRPVERLDGKYDPDSSLFIDRDGLDPAIDSPVILQTKTLFETNFSSKPVATESRGIRLVIGRHVLTLNHVVTQYGLEYVTPVGVVLLPSIKIEEKTYLAFRDQKLMLKDLLRDRELDIALFEIPANGLNLPLLSCPLGNSDELTVGTFLYVVGNPFNSGVNVREGIVSSLVGPEGISEISARRDELFMISNGVVPGDSGGPVLALRDGVPELVGIVQGTLGSTRIGWAIKINPITRQLSKYLDQDELHLAERRNSPS
jgi:S1-C subfamily serine protease